MVGFLFNFCTKIKDTETINRFKASKLLTIIILFTMLVNSDRIIILQTMKQQGKYSATICSVLIYMLWFNFCLGSNFFQSVYLFETKSNFCIQFKLFQTSLFFSNNCQKRDFIFWGVVEKQGHGFFRGFWKERFSSQLSPPLSFPPSSFPPLVSPHFSGTIPLSPVPSSIETMWPTNEMGRTNGD